MSKHKEWRKAAKKAMRRRKRIHLARNRDEKLLLEEEEKANLPSHKEWLEKQEECDKFFAKECERKRKMEHELWLQREKVAQERFMILQQKLKRLSDEKAKQELIIREEWEKEKQSLQKIAEARELEKQKCDAEQADFLERIEQYISGASEFLPSGAEAVIETLPNVLECPFYAKVAACRFGKSCSRNHIRPSVSNTLLLPGLYTHFSLDFMSQSNEYDTDVGLEYDEKELYNDFLQFYDDVLSELKKYGRVVQFKVCCNEEPHLKGNVYVQYEEQRCALKAFRDLHGRYYGGKRMSAEFCNINSWSRAICGLFKRKNCPKGGKCNFLHVFRNPDREFRNADRDMCNKRSRKSPSKEKSSDWTWHSPVRAFDYENEKRLLRCEKDENKYSHKRKKSSSHSVFSRSRHTSRVDRDSDDKKKR